MRTDDGIWRLRPHHGMCLRFFEGKGYSEEFTAHMQEMLDCFRRDPEAEAVLVTEPDEICSACPNRRAGRCVSEDKVLRYDRAVLSLTGLRAGEPLRFSQFSSLVQEKILDAGQRETVCGDCQWNLVCRRAERL